MQQNRIAVKRWKGTFYRKPVREFLPDDLWQLAKDFVYYAADSEGRQIPCAIDLNSTAFPAETGVSITPCYVGVISGSGRTVTAISWLRFVLEGP